MLFEKENPWKISSHGVYLKQFSAIFRENNNNINY